MTLGISPSFFLQDDRLQLLPVYSAAKDLRDLSHIRDQRSRLSLGIVLPKGDEVIILPGHQPSDVLCCGTQPVIGGYRDDHRPSVPQVALHGHGDRAISDAVCEFCEPPKVIKPSSFERSSSRVSLGERSSATKINGSSNSGDF